jgi:membrane protease YdiL (CAAX protease family)
MTDRAAAPGFWTVVWLLLGAARKRAAGRRRRAGALLRKRGSLFGRLPAFLGTMLGVGFGILLHVLAASDLAIAVSTAETVQAEANGRVVVEDWFVKRISFYEANAAKTPGSRDRITIVENRDIATEAGRLASQRKGDKAAIAARLAAAVHSDPAALLSDETLRRQPGTLPDIVALIIVAGWCLMMLCQGDGLEIDPLRSRNPMWEWLFSHPVRPGAVFLAEMIAPIVTNPVYLTAPAFPGMLYGIAYGWLGGVAAAALVGIPLAVALGCMHKAIEISVMLRLSPRLRGGVLGLMGWFAFASMLGLFFMATTVQAVATTVARWLLPLADWPWPPTRLLLGETSSGQLVFWAGLSLCWLLAASLIAAAIALSVAATRRGLTYRSQSAAAPARVATAVPFGRNPLYRKEMLWFRRDASALVQAVLIPLSLAALQVFNLRGVISNATGDWNAICGAAIVFGTYFLSVLGPKSLASEGQALWIAQTWPYGLEGLLKAKAKLWAEIASVIVGLVLLYAAFRFPSDLAGILFVAIAWHVFARSLADKTVTLATVTSSSGETERPSAGLRWAAMLGTLSFATGVLTRQWGFAIAGVVYSQLTAAAMWQNFRHRLPFLMDPWSATLPPPPTLLHAMVAISAMIEAVSVLSGLFLSTGGGRVNVSVTAIIYGLCAIVTAIGVSKFLAGRGVALRDIWLWSHGDEEPRPLRKLDLTGRLRVVLLIATGAALGAMLGLTAHLYTMVLHWWPDLAQALDAGRSRLDAMQGGRWAMLTMAVAFAPFAEEFLFRGLLYRALDREWGGWRAVVGAGAFFAIYHPVLSWAPVAALGMLNAMLFKRSGRLAPAVAAHMVYNAVVLAF